MLGGVYINKDHIFGRGGGTEEKFFLGKNVADPTTVNPILEVFYFLSNQSFTEVEGDHRNIRPRMRAPILFQVNK